jgi:hypothetical protein
MEIIVEGRILSHDSHNAAIRSSIHAADGTRWRKPR